MVCYFTYWLISVSCSSSYDCGQDIKVNNINYYRGTCDNSHKNSGICRDWRKSYHSANLYEIQFRHLHVRLIIITY